MIMIPTDFKSTFDLYMKPQDINALANIYSFRGHDYTPFILQKEKSNPTAMKDRHPKFLEVFVKPSETKASRLLLI